MAELENSIQTEELQPDTENNGLILSPQKPMPMVATMWNDTKLMNSAWKMANVLSQSSIIPQNYRGKQGDCVVAIDIGNRLGVSPIMVMQNSQVVQGNFTWKGAACKAFIDGCGKFKESEYIELGERGKPSWGCYLQAVNIKTGKLVKGVTVTIQMAQDEGWVNKNGSKWKTMPELMLRYRAATFFARTECPEVLMGFQTVEEIEDVKGVEPSKTVVKFSLDNADTNS